MPSTNVKQAAHQLIDQLPEGVTWDEVVYRFAMRASIERGLSDAGAGRLVSQGDVEKCFGIDQHGAPRR